MEGGDGKEGSESKFRKTKVRLAQVEDSGEHPWGVPGRELVTTQSYCVLDGFIKDVVAFQES